MTGAARLVLAAAWCWAGWAKLQQPEQSVQAVRAYRILPESWVAPVGHGLPVLELGIAVLLLLGVRVRLAALLSTALLVTFVGAIAQAMQRGLAIDCGCFGGGGEVDPADTHYAKEILRDLGLICPGVWLLCRPRSRYALDNVIT
ncbi:MauE/DoxX family redox-associated membrane protein [Streptomyces sp. NPDC093111]|uniref:MauE/DoxX family redox-associated membrane protein n=1 Tax=Streptomyces sp. NPDC093111 TaxID=3154978 RepID=UPI0034139980